MIHVTNNFVFEILLETRMGINCECYHSADQRHSFLCTFQAIDYQQQYFCGRIHWNASPEVLLRRTQAGMSFQNLFSWHRYN
jgi:hypothetical protein